MSRRTAPKLEPRLLWQDADIAVFLKGPQWLVTVSRCIAENKVLKRLHDERGAEQVRTFLESGRPEHFAHFLITKYKNDKNFALAEDTNCEFGIAHRLDVDTSGALMVAKTIQGFVHLRNCFNSHGIFKEYICLVHGAVKAQTDVIEKPIIWDEFNNVSSVSDKGSWAKSIYTLQGHYRLKGGKNIFSLCRVVIITGRTHQIRLHMSAIGHPLVGDAKYNSKQAANADNMWCPRTFLHAWRIKFPDCKGADHQVKAPLPPDLMASLKLLEEVHLDPDKENNPSIRLAADRNATVGNFNVPKQDFCFWEKPATTLPLNGNKKAANGAIAQGVLTPVEQNRNRGVAASTAAVPSQGRPVARSPSTASGTASGGGASDGLRRHLPPEPAGPPPGPPPAPEADVHRSMADTQVPPPPPKKAQASKPPKHKAPPASKAAPAEASRPVAQATAKEAVRPMHDNQHLQDVLMDVVCGIVGTTSWTSLRTLTQNSQVSSLLQQMGSADSVTSLLLSTLQEHHDMFEVADRVSGGCKGDETKLSVRLRSKQPSAARSETFREQRSQPTLAMNWKADGPDFERAVQTLVEMGFRKGASIQALQRNRGNLIEAMDMLAETNELFLGDDMGTQPPEVFAKAPPFKQALQAWMTPSGPTKGGWNFANKAQATRPKRLAATTSGNDKDFPALGGSIQLEVEEDRSSVSSVSSDGEGLTEAMDEEMRKAIKLSKKEAKKRQRQEVKEADQDLEQALAASLGGNNTGRRRGWGHADRQLQKALELSQADLEEKRRREAARQKLEEEAFEQACLESTLDYERFHRHQNADDEPEVDFEEALRRSLFDTESTCCRTEEEEEEDDDRKSDDSWTRAIDKEYDDSPQETSDFAAPVAIDSTSSRGSSSPHDASFVSASSKDKLGPQAVDVPKPKFAARGRWVKRKCGGQEDIGVESSATPVASLPGSGALRVPQSAPSSAAAWLDAGLAEMQSASTREPVSSSGATPQSSSPWAFTLEPLVLTEPTPEEALAFLENEEGPWTAWDDEHLEEAAGWEAGWEAELLNKKSTEGASGPRPDLPSLTSVAGTSEEAGEPGLEAAPLDYSQSSVDWLRERLQGLDLPGIDAEVLCCVLQEIETERLGDEDDEATLKMWLGFSPEDALPGGVATVISEYRFRRCVKHVA
eukprot:TRINITY_DN33449_c0_g1_i1.p1 TRINITY_DN33449_c0_g1~~TRINITY_DN33449_c0_g1_i1.p1  ORF type:complete len:1163 (+),score=202.42 TRINITY_DN33449_c0_g1_i1:152-3640(+)